MGRTDSPRRAAARPGRPSPETMAAFSDDGQGAQRRGHDGGPLFHQQGAEIELALRATLHADDDEAAGPWPSAEMFC